MNTLLNVIGIALFGSFVVVLGKGLYQYLFKD